MPETVTKWNHNYQLIEMSCRDKYHCNPCTYPNCQRSSRLSRTAVRVFGKG
jgi:hypothetical protein